MINGWFQIAGRIQAVDRGKHVGIIWAFLQENPIVENKTFHTFAHRFELRA